MAENFIDRHLDLLNIENLGHGQPLGQGSSTKRKKAINFLKEEMSNIRQGMNQLIRAKSEKNLKVIQLNQLGQENDSGKNKKIGVSQIARASITASEREVKYLRERVNALQAQNQHLQDLLRRKQEAEYIIKQENYQLVQQKTSLSIENEVLHMQINNLSAQINRLRRENKEQKQRLQKMRKAKSQEIPCALNPQTQQVLIKVRERAPLQGDQRLRKENFVLIDAVRKLESEVQCRALANVEKDKVIEFLNKRVVSMELWKINNRHRHLACQQNQPIHDQIGLKN